MKTKILDPEYENSVAGEILKNGGLVAIPTETVYGLAANALDPQAVKNIYIAKGRPSDNPLIVHVSDFEQVKPLVKFIPENAKLLAEKFWPGPLTLVFEKSDIIPNETSGNLDTVAIRIPNNACALDIIKQSGCPLAAPSANLSGKPSPTRFCHVYDDLKDRVDAIMWADDCEVGVESTVLTLCTNPPTLLRPGGISKEQIESVIGEIKVSKAVLEKVADNEKVESPGMKYKHYAPKANITMCKIPFTDFVKLVNENNANALCFDGEKCKFKRKSVSFGKKYDGLSQAQKLFSSLHDLDELNFETVYARAPQKTGVGMAVYNRLIRACAFRELKAECKIVGLTGQSGAGKSTVAKELLESGIAVIDCDEITKQPQTYTGKCLDELVGFFGEEILENGFLNRKALANKAFSSKKNTNQLNKITLPYIMKIVDNEINKLKEKGEKVIILDAPTLFEAKADNLCSHILSVVADEDIRKQRIIKRDNITENEAILRMNVQKSEEFYVNCADFVIKNNTEYKEQVLKFIEFIRGE